MDEVEQDTTGFTPLFAVAQATGILVVILTGIWMGHYLDGFGFDEDTIFNWHPLLMVLGLIYLYGNGILMYRVFRGERKKKLKLAHAIVLFSSFVFVVLGLRAAFASHDWKNKPNLYTLHSWVGLVTVILFISQWMGGLITFLFPGLASHLRARFMPIHIFSGMLIFTLACAAALLGISEKAIWSLQEKYQEKTSEAMMINWIGVLVIIFGVLVIYLVGNPRYKRLTKPEDEMLLQETINE